MMFALYNKSFGKLRFCFFLISLWRHEKKKKRKKETLVRGEHHGELENYPKFENLPIDKEIDWFIHWTSQNTY